MTNRDLGQLYFSMNGRVSRKTYWLNYFIPSSTGEWLLSMGDDLLLPLLWSVCWVWPGFCIIAKRMHDIDVSVPRVLGVFAGGLLAMFGLIFLVGAFYGWDFRGFSLGGQLGAAIFVSLPLLPVLYWNVKIFFFRGTVGQNRFGPDPVSE